MIDTEIVLRFIEGFHDRGNRAQVIETFTCGHCYWFALILYSRFSKYNPIIAYDEIENHFACKLDDKVYDITGDVTNSYNWIEWPDLVKKDRSLAHRIYRDCIAKEEYNE